MNLGGTHLTPGKSVLESGVGNLGSRRNKAGDWVSLWAA